MEATRGSRCFTIRLSVPFGAAIPNHPPFEGCPAVVPDLRSRGGRPPNVRRDPRKVPPSHASHVSGRGCAVPTTPGHARSRRRPAFKHDAKKWEPAIRSAALRVADITRQQQIRGLPCFHRNTCGSSQTFPKSGSAPGSGPQGQAGFRLILRWRAGAPRKKTPFRLRRQTERGFLSLSLSLCRLRITEARREIARNPGARASASGF